MLGQEVELTIEGRDPFTVRYTAVDLRRYESQFHKSVLIEPMNLTMLTFVGWSAARRTGELNGEFAKWEKFDEVCVDVRVVPSTTEAGAAGDGDAERPTKKAARTPKSRSGGS